MTTKSYLFEDTFESGFVVAELAAQLPGNIEYRKVNDFIEVTFNARQSDIAAIEEELAKCI